MLPLYTRYLSTADYGTIELLANGVIRDGMIPKVEAAIRATDGGCATHIIDARVPHALLLELLTERGVGTMLTETASP